MDLRKMSYFMWVFEEGSFNKASVKAGVGQPALSMQIRQFEEELGVRLFERGPRGVKPTPAATQLYQHGRSITRDLALARQAMAEIADSETVSGRVRVGLPPSLNRGLLSDVLLAFMERYPQVEISIAEAYTGTLTEWAAGGHVDFSLGARPSEAGGMIQRLVYQDKVVLVSGQPINGPTGTPCDLRNVADLKLILPFIKQSFSGKVRDLVAEGEINASNIIEIDGWVGGFELARDSGWGLLTPYVSVCTLAKQQGLFIYPISRPVIDFDFFLVYDQRRPITLAGRRFISMLESRLQDVSESWRRFTERK
ncbi:LysR family transcriptional regulator [Tepidamorphus sp. 3E244]|uniref:LysR family transcriptional regulator n=1 Tax=Tepidamorphus sp. 3E244 TaxID=3385498 RepID=UPI0038FC4F3E